MIIIDDRKIMEEVNKEIEKIEKGKVRVIDVEELAKKVIDAILETFEPEEGR